MGSAIEVILTTIGLSFWILFTTAMFLSGGYIDKNTGQIIRPEKRRGVFRPVAFDWHHPIIYFRRWLQHE